MEFLLLFFLILEAHARMLMTTGDMKNWEISFKISS